MSSLQSFQPPSRLLLGPGPSPVPQRILDALARPTIGHLDPAFIGMMDECKELLRYAFRTANAVTLPVSAPGSAGMEAAFVNLIEPGDTVIVCQNGVFGGRMRENVIRIGAQAVMVADPFGRPIDPDKVEAALKANPGAKALAFVHAETSTGAVSDAAALCKLAREHGALSIVDAVTSLGGIDVDVDGWGADAIYSGSQKCLAAPPGLSPLSFGEAAVAALKARKTPVQSWFLDLGLVINYWQGSGARAYHHTAPINMLYALHEALLMLREEGLEAAWARHRANHLRLRDGLAALDLRLFVEERARLPQLNAVEVPDGVDEAAVRRRLLDEHGIEIGAGLGELAGKIWRIGLMGAGSAPHNVDRVLAALGVVLGRKAA
ncbi:alanine--glyoxylate aminotransferase family protein [Dokdonella sp.]|uniref:pyridoxal-phosphate-dependent aminotransferase family protein n=1 Tax=Dokdonella sp. TaxID=2291710 RepID=UPI001AFF9F92|nr:alanine--glyoxylate aminotransferase family protein [Dokdonella sp.]MBO9662116.1 alanine--glyoxylate aminotransferase family protein [Dokdonella sp.]